MGLLEGKTAVVTGASRGIGEEIARVLHRDGATVVGVDVPQAASDLQTLMAELDGDLLTYAIEVAVGDQEATPFLRGRYERVSGH